MPGRLSSVGVGSPPRYRGSRADGVPAGQCAYPRAPPGAASPFDVGAAAARRRASAKEDAGVEITRQPTADS